MTNQTIFEFLSKDRPEYALNKLSSTEEEWDMTLNWLLNHFKIAFSNPENYTALELKNIHRRRANLLSPDKMRLGPASPIYPDLCEGYSEKELDKIEEIYHINITGQFRAFMKEMGRCSGGLIGWDPIFFYYTYGIKDYLDFNNGHQENMIEYGLIAYNRDKPFYFSCENETQYYFMLTGSEEPELVYHFDDNQLLITSTGMEFIDYIKDLVNRRTGLGLPVICRGDLLFDKGSRPIQEMKSHVKQFIKSKF